MAGVGRQQAQPHLHSCAMGFDAAPPFDALLGRPIHPPTSVNESNRHSQLPETRMPRFKSIAFGAALITASSYAVSAPSFNVLPSAAAPAVHSAESDDTAIHPFRVNIPQTALDDLRRRVRATHWPDKETVDDASQGPQLATMQALVQYWGTQYDWRKVESQLNTAAVHDEDRRRRHSLHPRPLEASECPADHHHAWLAGLRHRTAQPDRSAHRSRPLMADVRKTLLTSSFPRCPATASPASPPERVGIPSTSHAPGWSS